MVDGELLYLEFWFSVQQACLSLWGGQNKNTMSLWAAEAWLIKSVINSDDRKSLTHSFGPWVLSVCSPDPQKILWRQTWRRCFWAFALRYPSSQRARPFHCAGTSRSPRWACPTALWETAGTYLSHTHIYIHKKLKWNELKRHTRQSHSVYLYIRSRNL